MNSLLPACRSVRHRMLCIASAAAATFGLTASALGAGHRDAPALAFDPGADVSDVYAFRSWVDPGNVVLILNVYGGQEPGDAPLYFNFDDSVLHRLHVDVDQDGRADDVVYEVRFRTELKPAVGEFFFMQPYVGHRNIPIPELQGITALQGPNSAGMTLRQTYTVTEVRRGERRKLFGGRTLHAVPPYTGPFTMPDYEALAAQGIYVDAQTGIKAFAGQRAETFYGDVAGLFDTGNMRGFPLLSPEQEANDHLQPFGINRYRGSNVNSIAIEIPIERLTRDRRPAEATRDSIIGVYGSTSRSLAARLHADGPGHDSPPGAGRYLQVDRMANPMISQLLMDMPVKDSWRRSAPHADAQFEFYFKHPSPTRYPTTPYVFSIPSPPFPRLDLMQIFLKYPGQGVAGQSCGAPCADLLRLDLGVAPTPPAAQKRMGALLSADPAGLPNGRRPNDDAVDFGLRIVGGPAPRAARLADGVNFADGIPGAGTADGIGYGSVPGNRLDVTGNGIAVEFPYLPTPHSGFAQSTRR